MRFQGCVAFTALAAIAAGPATKPDAPAAAAAAPVVVPAAQVAPRTPRAPVGQIRELQGQEYSDAIEARDAADLLRAGYEQAHSRRRLEKHAAPPPAIDQEFENIVAAYRRAIERYPSTEFEHYCRLRLAGAYQFRGLFDRTLDEAKQDAERFAGTRFGMEGLQTVGLTYLQALHDPAQAEVWFKQLKAAAGNLRDEQERLKWDVAASEGLSRCARELGARKR